MKLINKMLGNPIYLLLKINFSRAELPSSNQQGGMHPCKGWG